MSTAITDYPLQSIPSSSSSSSSLTSSPPQSEPDVEDMVQGSNKTLPLIPRLDTSDAGAMDSIGPSLSQFQSRPTQHQQQSSRDLETTLLVGPNEHHPAYIQRQQRLEQLQQRELLYHHHLQHKQKQQRLVDVVSRNHHHQQYQCQSNQDHEHHQLRGQAFGGFRQQEWASRHMNWQGEENEDEERVCAKTGLPSLSVGSEGLPDTPFFCSIFPVDMRAGRCEQGGMADTQKSSISSSSSKNIMRNVNLVEDVWRMIFYILAQDCKDLGRCMQVNRRFHNLIAHDALLWKLTYNLTVSGSIFTIQKPLLSSPSSWIRENRNRFTDMNIQHGEGIPSYQDDLELPFVSHHRPASPSRSVEMEDVDMNSTHQRTHHMGADLVEEVSSGSSSSSSSSSSPTLSVVGSRRDSLTLIPGLQMPAPLALPHHHRIVQTIISRNGAGSNNILTHNGSNTNSSSNHLISNDSTNHMIQPIVDRSIDPESLPSFNPGTFLDDHRLGTTGWTRTPTSTPAPSFGLSFRPILSSTVSQVVSNSTTPLCLIQRRIPTTTLMHHSSPASYWKYKVVEWLEQEKLKCLRLGLFWTFNVETSRMRGRKARW